MNASIIQRIFTDYLGGDYLAYEQEKLDEKEPDGRVYVSRTPYDRWDFDRMFSTDIRAYGGTCLRTGVRAADRGSAFEKRGWADIPDRARAGCQ